jgi:hypothetical protein
MVNLSKKQRDTVLIPLAIGLIIFLSIDLLGSWLFDFEISSFVGTTIVIVFTLAISSVNLIYYWRGEGAESRDRSDTLRTLVVATIFLTLMLGGYLWFG